MLQISGVLHCIVLLLKKIQSEQSAQKVIETKTKVNTTVLTLVY
jgi:hypothetical protein